MVLSRHRGFRCPDYFRVRYLDGLGAGQYHFLVGIRIIWIAMYLVDVSGMERRQTAGVGKAMRVVYQEPIKQRGEYD